MKTFLRQCPLVAVVAASAVVAALALGSGAIVPAGASKVPSAGSAPSSAVAAAASVPKAPPASAPASSSPSPAPSSAPVSSAASKPAAPSSARNSAPPPPSRPTPPRPENGLLRPVDRAYFDDALFIGDSLTEDLKKYGGLGNASYFCRVGLNIYQLFETPKESALSGLTLEQTLRGHQYRKIYIMLGINELGTGTTKYFVRHYSEALEKIRALQPDAILYVQSILPVSEEKSESDPVFKNSSIRDRNAGLQTLDNGKNVFYLDVAPAVSDRNGDLCTGYSGDDVHLKAKYYPLWTDFLLKHGVPYEDAVFS